MRDTAVIRRTPRPQGTNERWTTDHVSYKRTRARDIVGVPPVLECPFWLPLVDALRTRLVAPAPGLIETLDRFRSSASVRPELAAVSLTDLVPGIRPYDRATRRRLRRR